ncbi:MAG: hypothetical protein ACR2P8_16190 [Myxococcota bacterium]
MARTALGVLLLLALSGCQSVRSWDQCPGIYSGLRYYSDQLPELPGDGKAFFTLDVPLTTIADTLAIPFTAFAEPEQPPGGFAIGCRWADPRRRR